MGAPGDRVPVWHNGKPLWRDGVPLLATLDENGNVPSNCCCGGGETCVNCEGLIGSAQIEVTGYANQGVPACDRCDRINGTWILPRVADESDCCTWELCNFADIDDGTGFAAICDYASIFMRLCLVGSDYLHDIRIEITDSEELCQGDQNGGVSARNLGTEKPSCSDMEGTFNGNLSLYCDASAAQFTVTML